MDWMVFVLDGVVLHKMSVDGYTSGEITSTRELLAYENEVDPREVRVYFEEEYNKMKERADMENVVKYERMWSESKKKYYEKVVKDRIHKLLDMDKHVRKEVSSEGVKNWEWNSGLDADLTEYEDVAVSDEKYIEVLELFVYVITDGAV